MDQAAATPMTARRSGPLAGRAARARRQVDLAPGAHLRRARGGRDPHHRPARRRGRHQHRESHAGAGRAVERTGEGAWSVQRRRGRRFCRTGRPARFRQFRHRLPPGAWARSPAARSPPPSTATDACASGRCSACSIRSSAWARARSPPPTAAACRSRCKARATRSRSSTDRRCPRRSSSPPSCSPGSPRRARPRWSRPRPRATTPSAC